jgi:tetratricopeptide (TPR) repeat protein
VLRLSRAVALDPSDARAWVALADAHERKGAYLDALDALEHALEADPSEAVRKTLERVRERSEFAKLPPEFKAIGGAAQISRGDLAALLGIRVLPFMPAGRSSAGVVVTDARAHWAATWILGVTRAGLMEAYPNHTFQPGATVRRVDLAAAITRVLIRLGQPDAKAGRKEPIADVPADHLSYPAVAAAVGSGVMALQDGGMFRPSRPVTGAEAVEAISRLESLAKRAGAVRTR